MSSLLAALMPNELVIQVIFAGIQASDVNYSAGRYDPRAKPRKSLSLFSLAILHICLLHFFMLSMFSFFSFLFFS